MHYRNLIWDFDGTLYDTYPHTASALSAFVKESRGIDVPPVEIEKEIRVSMKLGYQRFGMTPDEIALFLSREADMTRWTPAALYPGARALLTAAKNAGLRQFLYTHRDHVAVDCLKAEGLDGCFEGIVTSELGLAHKPAPDGVKYILNGYDLRPTETIMIGDREIDVLSGFGAGVDGMLITGGDAPGTVARYVLPDLFAAAAALEIAL